MPTGSRKPVTKLKESIKMSNVRCNQCDKRTGFVATGYIPPSSARGGIMVQGKCDAGHETWSIVSRDTLKGIISGGCPCAYGGSSSQDDVTEEPVIDAPDVAARSSLGMTPGAAAASSSKARTGSRKSRHSRKGRSHSRSHSRSGSKSSKSRSRSHSRGGSKKGAAKGHKRSSSAHRRK